jgi:hypothetical protein
MTRVGSQRHREKKSVTERRPDNDGLLITTIMILIDHCLSSLGYEHAPIEPKKKVLTIYINPVINGKRLTYTARPVRYCKAEDMLLLSLSSVELLPLTW